MPQPGLLLVSKNDQRVVKLLSLLWREAAPLDPITGLLAWYPVAKDSGWEDNQHLVNEKAHPAW